MKSFFAILDEEVNLVLKRTTRKYRAIAENDTDGMLFIAKGEIEGSEGIKNIDKLFDIIYNVFWWFLF